MNTHSFPDIDFTLLKIPNPVVKAVYCGRAWLTHRAELLFMYKHTKIHVSICTRVHPVPKNVWFWH